MTDPRDPRTLGVGPADDLAFANAEAGPAVARQGGALPTAFVALAVVLLGFLAFMWMSGQRTQREQAPITAPVANAPQVAAAPPPPVDLPEAPPSYTLPPPQFTIQNTLPAAPAPPVADALAPPTPTVDPNARRRAPAMIVDLGPGAPEAATAAAAAAPTAAAKAGDGGTAAFDAKADAVSGIAAEDRFAARVGAGEAERVRATALHNLDRLVPQGAVIPGVLETAVNSDLPGFARAVVSRDVRGFDGTEVLIPRGSRLIGQYKSGLALGASRVFVIWTRVIRPDGVSIQIGSPGTDDLGRAGVTGEVDRHFFQRFGGSILLSVLNAGLYALSDNRPTAQVVIGSASDATNVASSALTADQSRPPTVKTPQGSPIRIFVARDLDFSGVAKVVTPK